MIEAQILHSELAFLSLLRLIVHIYQKAGSEFGRMVDIEEVRIEFA
jgi:hypothetical protein